MDINLDGHGDILSGSYSRPRTDEHDMAGLFHVLYGSASGKFAKPVPLEGTDGEDLTIPIASRKEIRLTVCTRPSAVDWDGDGDLDLLVGNFDGGFYLFEGLGAGKYEPTPTILKAGKEPLKIPGVHGDPMVVDWDGDGDLDILSGSSDGGVYWSENRGSGDLTGFKTIIEAGPPENWSKPLNLEAIHRPTSSTRIWVTDVNGDEKLDLLVGDRVTVKAEADPERTGFVWFYAGK